MQAHLRKLNAVDGSSAPSPVPSEALTVIRHRSLYERRFKRSLDFAGAFLILLLTLPISLGIAAAIRIGLGRHVLYSQDRVGRGGVPFVIWKFRTMRPDRRRSEPILPIDQDRRVDHKVDDDPRHTGLGRLLRRLSLDELPQLVNVLRGDMSLVGPRPELVTVAEERGYRNHIRHDVRPGMTGPYQVSGLRLNGDLRDGLAMDEEYVTRLSLVTDLQMLFWTVRLMFGGSSGT